MTVEINFLKLATFLHATEILLIQEELDAEKASTFNKMLKGVLLEFIPTEKGRECPDNKGIYGLVTHFVHAMPLFS